MVHHFKSVIGFSYIGNLGLYNLVLKQFSSLLRTNRKETIGTMD